MTISRLSSGRNPSERGFLTRKEQLQMILEQKADEIAKATAAHLLNTIREEVQREFDARFGKQGDQPSGGPTPSLLKVSDEQSDSETSESLEEAIDLDFEYCVECGEQNWDSEGNCASCRNQEDEPEL